MRPWSGSAHTRAHMCAHKCVSRGACMEHDVCAHHALGTPRVRPHGRACALGCGALVCASDVARVQAMQLGGCVGRGWGERAYTRADSVGAGSSCRPARCPYEHMHVAICDGHSALGEGCRGGTGANACRVRTLYTLYKGGQIAPASARRSITPIAREARTRPLVPGVLSR